MSRYIHVHVLFLFFTLFTIGTYLTKMFECEIKFKTVPWTNQYWAMRVKFLVQGNNRILWWCYNSWLTDYESDALTIVPYATSSKFITVILFLPPTANQSHVCWYAILLSNLGELMFIYIVVLTYTCIYTFFIPKKVVQSSFNLHLQSTFAYMLTICKTNYN